MPFWVIIAAVCLAAGISVFAVARLAIWLRERSYRTAHETFFIRREWLEAEFLKLASLRGIPRGLVWADCDFDNDVQFAKDRASGQMRALVGVTIRFEAVQGGGMEHVEAVSNLRAATAVFFYDGRKWTTSGRALFNLNPSEAIHHYRHELETMDLP